MPEWVFIDTAVLRSAREAKGLSYETMSRTIPVAAKTWERYEKAGRIPRPILPAVARTLDLDIEEAAPRKVIGQPAPEEVAFAVEAIDRLEQLAGDVKAIDRKLDVQNVDGRLKSIEAELSRLSRAVASIAR